MFYNYNPIKLIHGEGALQRASMEISENESVAIIHGATLEMHAVEARRLLGVLSSPTASWIRINPDEPTEESINDLIRKIPTGTTLILGIGGGSVMDSTKATAVCYGNGISPAELKNSSNALWKNTTKFGLVATRPGTGSEFNNAFVLMDASTKFKRSYFSLYTYPSFSIQDPLFYNSLLPADYASGLADAVSHVIDQYLTSRDPKPVQDLMSLGFLKIGRELGKLIRSPSTNDFLQLAWFGALASSGLLSRGVTTSWVLHEVAHSLASVKGLPHAHSIAAASRAVMNLPRHPPNRLKQVAQELLGELASSQNALSDGDLVAKFFSALGLPTSKSILTKEDVELWETEAKALCPNLTSEEVSHLCKFL